MSRAPIAAVVLPHGFCLPGCPYCPAGPGIRPDVLLPGPEAVGGAIDRLIRIRRLAGLPPVAVELGFYGGDLQQLPRGPRTALLDAAELEVRRGRAASIRLTAAPASVLRASLSEWRSRGVRAVEIPVHSLDVRVLRGLGQRSRKAPRLGPEAVARVNRARMRSIVHLTPGLPASSHATAMRTLDGLLRAHPRAARVLPALVLEGTRLAAIHGRGGWHPMSATEAVSTVSRLLTRLRGAGVEVIRVGLQPESDLLLGPQVLAGPWDPDLRARAEGEIQRGRAVSAIARVFELGTRAFTLVVHPAEEAWLRGVGSLNLHLLRARFRLDQLRVLPLPEQPSGELRAFPGLLGPDEVPALPPKPRRRAS